MSLFPNNFHLFRIKPNEFMAFIGEQMENIFRKTNMAV
ncbi:hypothetical protein RINTHH_22630 [Richelia intracellularis HH01]|uniref:Uncharacterized protein n=1 Tax=Richelia intracellularis HH01 TaxID=1165094 RepID=M1X1Q2_9NOST|nr:hypothetical protein RINTHH_22630 [Richelia intracellularis HH01]